MRDWLLILTPIVLFFYFLLHPDQFDAVTSWVVGLAQWLAKI